MINDKFRGNWIDFMTEELIGVSNSFNVLLDLPESLSDYMEMPHKFYVKYPVILYLENKYNKSIEVRFEVFGDVVNEILYLPVSHSVEKIFDTVVKKITKKVNESFQERQTIMINYHKEYVGSTWQFERDGKSSTYLGNLEKANKQRLRKEKLKRVNEG